MLNRFVAWFKIRFVFTDGQLMDAVEMIDFAERKKLLMIHGSRFKMLGSTSSRN